MNFEGGIKDASKENWDVVGAGVQTTSDGDFKQVGVFSGSAPVLVHTYLTTRVARVAQQESQEYKLTAPHPVPGVSGSAVYTLRNSSDLTQKTWVHRDPFFRYHDYTLSVFIRPDVDMNEGDSSPTSPRIFSDTQIGDSAIRWYANGELRIALLRYGCWAKPIKGGLRGGQWVHLAAVVNFVAKTCVVYMNGVPMSSGEMPALEDATEEEDNSASLVSRLTTGSRPTTTTSKTSSKSSRTSLARSKLASDATHVGLAKKKVSLCLVNMAQMHTITEKASDETVINMHSEYLTSVLEAFAAGRAIAGTFAGDKVMGSFNAVRNCGGHVTSAAKVALELKRVSVANEKAGKPTITCAIVTGACKVGNLGVTGMKKFTVIGSIVSWLHALERYGSAHGFSPIADNDVFDATLGQMSCMLVSAVDYPKRELSATRIFVIASVMESGEEEWMYQLAEREAGDVNRKWNKFVTHIVRNNWDAVPADFSIEQHQHVPEAVLKKVKEAVMEKHYTPETITYH